MSSRNFAHYAEVVKGIVSRDFRWLQMILKYTVQPDIPLHVYRSFFILRQVEKIHPAVYRLENLRPV